MSNLSLDQFRELMRKQAEEDKQRKSIQVSGENIDDALKQAGIELGLPVGKLEFEVLDKGNKGVLGMKKRNCLLIVYESEKAASKIASGETGGMDFYTETDDVMEGPVDQDGRYSIRLSASGAYVKVIPEVNNGLPVEKQDIINALNDRSVHDIDMLALNQVMQRQDSMFVKVGDFIYNPANDPLFKVTVSDDEMECFIIISPPGPGGADATREDIENFLTSNGIEFGVDGQALDEYEEFPVYGEPYLVAQGDKPMNGDDAKVVYQFDTNPKGKVKINPDGTVDFKELNKIQNVVKGQPLAKKIPPQPGKDGRTVYGRYLPAKDGKDVEIGLGKNVTITDNGNTVVASVSGQVQLVKGKITVETVLVIPGNVDSSTGNVSGLGTVIVKGNVEDGFTVKAQGTIEVIGYVARANLSAGQDIIVKKGINGGDDREYGHIVAGNSLWASFVQNATIEAGDIVAVSDGIVNSSITAKHKVLCKGKRAKIVGGIIKTAEEINATTFGSTGGVETVLEVGYDPKTKEELDVYEKQREELDEELTEVDRNIQGLLKQRKRMRNKLSKEKEQLFINLKDKHNELLNSVKEVTEEITRRQEYLDTLKSHGKISASKNVHSGVKIHIRDAVYEVTTPYDAPVTFILENGFVKTTEYEAITDEIARPEAASGHKAH